MQDNKVNGIMVTFIRESKEEDWKLYEWDAIWSKMGSADDFTWPYYR